MSRAANNQRRTTLRMRHSRRDRVTAGNLIRLAISLAGVGVEDLAGASGISAAYLRMVLRGDKAAHPATMMSVLSAAGIEYRADRYPVLRLEGCPVDIDMGSAHLPVAEGDDEEEVVERARLMLGLFHLLGADTDVSVVGRLVDLLIREEERP